MACWECSLLRTTTAYAALVLLAAVVADRASAEILIESDVFVGGAEGPEGTSNYRIPAMVIAPDGSILAFAEGRRSDSDPGQAGHPIDMVFKRSTDGGRTWSPLSVLRHDPAFDYSDPRPIVDAVRGQVHLLYTQWPDACGQGCVPGGLASDSSVAFLQSSSDNGRSWSGPTNINQQVKDPAWRVFNTGPGSGIQLRWQTDPGRNGRLVDPGHMDAGGFQGVVAYSDDGGKTWSHGRPTAGPGINESEIVELISGELLYDGRGDSGSFSRERYQSSDGGSTWTYVGPGDVPVTRVDATLVRYSAIRDGDDRNRLLFAAALGNPPGSGNGRSNMGVWTSYDEGQTFINPVQLATGHAAYCNLGRLADGTIALLYEATGSTRIRYLNCDLAELEGRTFTPATTHFEGFCNTVDPFRGGIGFSGGWTHDGVEIRDAGGLEFPTTAIEADHRHAHLKGGILTRRLGQPLDLEDNQAYYVSLYVRRDSSDDEAVAGSGEQLDIRLLAGSQPRFTFGIQSDESLFVQNASRTSTVTTKVDGFEVGEPCFLLVKIVSRERLGPGGADQIFLSAYDDPTAIPRSESQVVWLLTGAAGDNFSGVIDRIQIAGGPAAEWNIDSLRIATGFEGVLD